MGIETDIDTGTGTKSDTFTNIFTNTFTKTFTDTFTNTGIQLLGGTRKFSDRRGAGGNGGTQCMPCTRGRGAGGPGCGRQRPTTGE
ncbi:hypothetical protein ACH4UR_22625 [Streptomyces lydicus]|uniref:hypothetical protein n=1 Tax=Streptomyces lydicus TaxID=47763 RepID=UPI0033D009B6